MRRCTLENNVLSAEEMVIVEGRLVLNVPEIPSWKALRTWFNCLLPGGAWSSTKLNADPSSPLPHPRFILGVKELAQVPRGSYYPSFSRGSCGSLLL